VTQRTDTSQGPGGRAEHGRHAGHVVVGGVDPVVACALESLRGAEIEAAREVLVREGLLGETTHVA
jgi:hypothetical protein